MILDAEEDIDVAGEAANGREAVDGGAAPATGRRAHGRPHARSRRDRGDTTLAGGWTERTPKVVMLTTFDMDEYVYDALRAGASGFLLKDVPPEQLVAGIRAVASGRRAAGAVRDTSGDRGVRPPSAFIDADAAARARRADRTRARGAEADRTRPLECGDREGALRQRDDREDTRRARLDEARSPRSSAGRRARLRDRPRRPGDA